MINIQEKKAFSVSGWGVLVLVLAMSVGALLLFLGNEGEKFNAKIALGLVLVLASGLTGPGFFVIHPNEAKVLTFVGKYVGSCRTPGFHWTNPLTVKKKVSLRIGNLDSEKIKVNDARGNPIEIAAVIVWHVVDTAKAAFNVENYKNFVAIQSETAIRQLATHYPYDSHDTEHESLRGNADAIAAKLRDQVQERLLVSGVNVVEARISHLAYAPEIAQVMLRRQQAEAIIAARRQIVDGAVGMVDMALKSLEASGVVRLDEEKKAAMVNNLLVALVSENEATPIINTGTLYA
ncbi:MAG: SPFH domain-containing protein [Candidatus Aminicenantes bacterium]|nr:SPFH domain-containing protein [Candidatus Aminicenantes bacterium]